MAQTVGAIDPSTVPGGSGGYEIHQKLRTKTVRLLKKEKYNEAIDILYNGSVSLLDMNEQGSGCDLAVYLLEVYGLAKTPVDDTSRDRLTTILGKTTAEFWRKKVILAAVKWSTTSSRPLGDAKLRLFIAELLVKDKQYFAAETHFIAACAQDTAGVPAFAAMLKHWNEVYSATMAKRDPHAPSGDSVARVLAGTFALRGAIPLLIAKAPDAAHELLSTYIKQVTENNDALLLPVKPNPKEYQSPANGIASFSTKIYATANPTLNFVQNIVALACDAHHRSGPVADEIKAAWQHLIRQYMQESGTSGVDAYLYEFLSQISSIYFGMAPQRRNMDMLSSMFSNIMGGGAPAAGESAEPAVSIKQLPKPADADESDAAPAAPPASEADQLMDDEMD